jgi:hypothetical protein
MNKQTLKRLKSFADMLPPSWYEGKYYQSRDMKDLRAKEIKNTAVSLENLSSDLMISGSDKPITIKGNTLYPVNHKRRIKEAYIKSGAQGVIDYFKWVDTNNAAINMKYDMKLISNILTEKVKASISEFM